MTTSRGLRGGAMVWESWGEQLTEHPSATPPSQGQPRDRSTWSRDPQRGEGLDRDRPQHGE
eukprot:7046824-Pyramimonas_sp.AAC.1